LHLGVRNPGTLLGAMIIGGLATGMAVPALSDAAAGLTIPALGCQTFLTVGSLPSLGGRAAAAQGARLAGLHLAALTLPLVAVAVAFDLDTPLGFGLFVLAVVPPAALVPTFAEMLGVDVGAAVAFCLLSYTVALVVTPVALLLASGENVGGEAVLSVLALGLLAPTLLGRLCHRLLERLPTGPRHALVSAAVFVVTLGLGGDLLPGLTGSDITPTRLVLVGVLVVLRTAGSGWAARRLSPPDLRDEAPLAGGFKNIALAAGASGVLMGSAAAIPSLLSFPAEALYFIHLSRRGGPPPSPGGKVGTCTALRNNLAE
jgi:predicted Na+-dependent transporter